jgi:hypothetical protein
VRIGAPLTPPYLSQLLADRNGIDSENGPLDLRVEMLGTLPLPSGRIVASDATDPTPLPFARQVEPGNCQAMITVARLADQDEVVAAAWLRIQEGTPERWEPAHWKGQSKLRHPRPAYAVDSSLGAFLSVEAAERLAELEDLVDLVHQPFQADGAPASGSCQCPAPINYAWPCSALARAPALPAQSRRLCSWLLPLRVWSLRKSRVGSPG